MYVDLYKCPDSTPEAFKKKKKKKDSRYGCVNPLQKYVCRSRQMSRLHSGSQRMMIMMMKFAKINPQRQKNILTQLQNKFLQNTKKSDSQN